MNLPRNSTLQKESKTKQLAPSVTSTTFCTTTGARITQAPLMGDIGFRWPFDAVDCIHLFLTRCHNQKSLLQRAGLGFKVQSLFLPSIAAAFFPSIAATDKADCYTSGINTHEATGKATAEALLWSLPHNSTHLYGITIEYIVSSTCYHPVHKCDA